MTKSEKMADSRDMLVIHDMFRREFAAIPQLVRDVDAGDTTQAAIVADHVEWMVTFLHTHHEGEDMMVWPRLIERCPTETEPLIFTMESQHHHLAQALDSLAAKATGWRGDAGVATRDDLATTASDLLLVIAEHLDLEERKVLSLIDAHLTEKEWKQVGGEGLKKMNFGQLKVAFGTILHGSTPEQLRIMRDTIPRPAWIIFSLLGPRAYTKHTNRLRRPQAAARPTTV